jgi:hypothetical protein
MLFRLPLWTDSVQGKGTHLLKRQAMRGWRWSATYSYPGHKIKPSSHFHTPAVLPKERAISMYWRKRMDVTKDVSQYDILCRCRRLSYRYRIVLSIQKTFNCSSTKHILPLYYKLPYISIHSSVKFHS